MQALNIKQMVSIVKKFSRSSSLWGLIHTHLELKRLNHFHRCCQSRSGVSSELTQCNIAKWTWDDNIPYNWSRYNFPLITNMFLSTNWSQLCSPDSQMQLTSAAVQIMNEWGQTSEVCCFPPRTISVPQHVFLLLKEFRIHITSFTSLTERLINMSVCLSLSHLCMYIWILPYLTPYDLVPLWIYTN